jgi:hypothetical protein
MDVRTGQFYYLIKFREKVWDFQVSIVGELHYQETVYHGMQDIYDPGHQTHNTETGVHDNCVMQGVTDGHKAVIGHQSAERCPTLKKAGKKSFE